MGGAVIETAYSDRGLGSPEPRQVSKPAFFWREKVYAVLLESNSPTIAATAATTVYFVLQLPGLQTGDFVWSKAVRSNQNIRCARAQTSCCASPAERFRARVHVAGLCLTRPY